MNLIQALVRLRALIVLCLLRAAYPRKLAGVSTVGLLLLKPESTRRSVWWDRPEDQSALAVIDIDPGHPSDNRRSLSASLGSRDVEVTAGSSVYLSKTYADKTRALRAAIWAEFNGTNHNALAAKHGVSRQFIYWTIRVGDPATNPNESA